MIECYTDSEVGYGGIGLPIIANHTHGAMGHIIGSPRAA